MTGTKMANELKQFFPKLTKVVDAKVPRAIQIEDSDIMLGDPQRPYACATARCLMRTNPGAIPVVSERYTYLIDTQTGVGTRFANSFALRTQIRNYDLKASFVPGEYTIGVVNHAHAIGTVHKAAKTMREPRRAGHRAKRIVRGWRELMDAAKALRAKVATR